MIKTAQRKDKNTVYSISYIVTCIKYLIQNTKYKIQSSAFGAGFTLVELLVAATILATLIGGATLTLNPIRQLNKGKDATRQRDLQSIKVALDAYYNDNNCYPLELPFDQEWKSVNNNIYMKKVPQDPECNNGEGSCYRYRTDTNAQNNCPQWNVLFAQLSKESTLADACPLSSMSNCVPEGYSDAVWACTLSGAVDCSALTTASTLTGGVETVLPTNTPTPGPTATPTPFPPGSVTYSIGNPAGENPDIYEVTMIPLYQTIGSTQSIQVKADDTVASISAMTMVLYSDNESREFALTRTGGVPTAGIFTGTWEVTDTYNRRYGVDITGTDSAGNIQTEELRFEN